MPDVRLNGRLHNKYFALLQQPVEKPWNLGQTEMSGPPFSMIQKLLVHRHFYLLSFFQQTARRVRSGT